MIDPLLLAFKQKAVESSRHMDPMDLEIDLLGMFPFGVRSPNKTQTIYGPYIQVQLSSGAEGICIAYDDVDIRAAFQFVGSSAISAVNEVGLEVQIALVDAVYEHINVAQNLTPHETLTFQGKPAQKALDRARFITSLAEATKGERIGVVGCIEPIVRYLVEVDSNVRIADLHSAHQSICGITIERDAVPIIDWADKLILTGNVLWTQTLSHILERASKRQVFVLVYAMTGHHIAPHYLEFGADIVTAEYFPFYWFANSASRLEVYRKQFGR